MQRSSSCRSDQTQVDLGLIQQQVPSGGCFQIAPGMKVDSHYIRLNLAVANRVHLIEPQWNPMTEEQAIGRVLRLLQKRQVTVIRYIMEDTVEKVFLRH